MRFPLLSLLLCVSCAHASTPEAATVAPASDAPAVIHFETSVEDMSVFLFTRQLAEAAESGKPVTVVIDTPGGSVFAGMAMSKAIERSKVPVICVVDGMSASMGLYILQSCSTRLMTARSLLMGHEAAGEVRGQPDQVGGVAELLKKLSHALAAHIVSKSKLTAEEYEAKIAHGRELWLTAEEALASGFVDGVVSSAPN